MTMKLLGKWHSDADKGFAKPSSCKGAQINVEVGANGTVNAFFWKGPKPSAPIPLTEKFNILDADIGNEVWFESTPQFGFTAVTKRKSIIPDAKKVINLKFEFKEKAKKAPDKVEAIVLEGKKVKADLIDRLESLMDRMEALLKSKKF